MQDKKESYRSIFKATSLFGGVQVFQILIQIIKSKFIAVLLGPAGVGIIGLYQSGMQLVQNLTNMGLASSAVRDVSEADGKNDFQRVSIVINVIRRLVWGTGLLGLLALAIFSPVLSKASFGNYDYTVPFIILSVTMLLDQICAGQKVVLQGLRKLKDLAKCTVVGSAFGLIMSVPLYYLLGIEGIVPTLLLNSICALIISWFYSHKIPVEKVKVSNREALQQGRTMLVMGLSMSLSGILTTASAYVIRAYIQNVGGVEEVGLFQAGFLIMSTYVGLIFNAIATDYYPRLAAVNHDNTMCKEIINQQGEIATLILGPMLAFCLVFMPFVLRILYSDEFLRAFEYICWACIGMLLRLAAWGISYAFVAKSESKLFMILETSAAAYSLLFSLIGYHVWGLKGIGLAFSLQYLVYFLQVYLIAKKKYDFQFSASYVKTYLIQLFLLVTCLMVVLLLSGWQKYAIGTVVMAFSIYFGILGLNKRMNIVDAIHNKLHHK